MRENEREREKGGKERGRYIVRENEREREKGGKDRGR